MKEKETTIKNTDVMEQIKGMLKSIKGNDKNTHEIILTLLDEVFKEYNSGKNRDIENKLYQMIDNDVRFKLKQ